MQKINKESIKKISLVVFDLLILVLIAVLLKDIINPTTFLGWVVIIILLIVLTPVVNTLNKKHLSED